MQRDDFIQHLGSDGFQEIVTVTREPDGMLDTHVHPFEAKALVLDGALWIICGAHEQHYAVGDVFHLQANQPHAERYGPSGVTYLVGRK
jgi:quercetin dioxygenase-like cupin family protein